MGGSVAMLASSGTALPALPGYAPPACVTRPLAAGRPPRPTAGVELPLCQGAAWAGASAGALFAVRSGSRSRGARRGPLVWASAALGGGVAAPALAGVASAARPSAVPRTGAARPLAKELPARLAARAEQPLCRGVATWAGASAGALLAASSGSRSRVARRCVVVLRRARVKFGKGKAGVKSKVRTRQSKAKSSKAFPKLPPEDVFSLDVECVAVGKTHLKSDREPCSLALVDGFGATLMRTLIQPVRPVVSYLTPYTGLRMGDLDGGKAISLARATQDLKRLLPKRAVLVGQNPLGDVEWMHLKDGVDYTSIVDLADVFANDRDMKFSLRHEALVLLGKDATKGVHDPSWDAAVSVELYRKAADATPKELDAMRERLTDKKHWPPKPSLARECGYQIDGVCLSCYVAEHCICGAPIEGDTRR